MNHTETASRIFPVSNTKELKQRMLNWVHPFSIFCFLDNHEYIEGTHSLECIVAAGAIRTWQYSDTRQLKSLQRFIDEKPSWLFGHIGYDLKNEIFSLRSLHPDGIGFADMLFFEPEIVLVLRDSGLYIEAENPEQVYGLLMECPNDSEKKQLPAIAIQQRLSKEKYLETINRLQQHILRGDCYEINFCQEFFSENIDVDPLSVYQILSNISPTPFSAFYRVENRYLLCASPERFLKKAGSRIFSQPMKGTARRVEGSAAENEKNRSQLQESAKDRAENVIVVDLVRNDLSQICVEGTVTVDELYGIYTFPQVYQMISSVSGELKKETEFCDIIRATFPMGSMTGAPKRSVLKLIEKFEVTRRGLFSGAVGYISPEQDFDFNVVIRSIQYNAGTKYLSFETGSAITYYSDPEKEWEECMLKAEGMKTCLRNEDKYKC